MVRDLSTENSEHVAQKLMHEVLSGDTNALDTFLSKDVEPGLLDHVLTQLKNAGNQSFRQGRYKEAVEFYIQCLIGTKDNHQRAILYSNISAAYTLLKDYKNALNAARDAISADPDWSKGWFRAAQIFIEKKNFIIALQILKAALQKAEKINNNNQTDVQDLISWVKRMEPLAAKEKAIERLTVDYSRFADIDTFNEEQELNNGTASNATRISNNNVIEYAEHLSNSEKAQLEALLTGNSQNLDTINNTHDSLPRLTFDFSKIEQPNVKHLKFDCKKSCDKIRLGLLNLLQTQSELNFPKLIAEHQILSKRNLKLFNLLIDFFVIALHPSRWEHMIRNNNVPSCLLLGTGAGITLVTICKLFEKYEFVDKYDGKQHNVYACTNRRYPFLAWMAYRMCEINDIALDETGHVSIISKRINEVSIQQNNEDQNVTSLSKEQETTKNHHPLDDHLVDIPNGKTNILVLDPSIFDCSGIGTGALFDIRHARKTLVTSGLTVSSNDNDETGSTPLSYPPIVVPARLQLWVHGAFVGKFLLNSSNVNLNTCVQDGLWGIHWEPFDLPDPSVSPHGYLPVTESRLIFEFVFDGPLNSLNTDIPIQSIKDVCFSLMEPAEMNALVLNTRLLIPKASNTDYENLETPFKKDSYKNYWVHGTTLPGVLWLPTKISLKENLENKNSVSITFSQNGTKVSASVVSSQEHIDYHNHIYKKHYVLPRWQFSYLLDEDVNNKWNTVLTCATEAVVQCSVNAVDKPSRFLRHGEKTKSERHVEILLLNSSLGTSAVVSLRTAANILAQRLTRPNPLIHLTTVEPSESHAITAALIVRSNALFIDETFIATSQSISASASSSYEKAWTYFGNNRQSYQEQEKYLKEKEDKAKQLLKTRLTVTSRDPRRLRPPEKFEDGETQMALARLLGAPAGPSGPVLPPAVEGDRLPDKADILALQILDCGLLGEGLLPLLNYFTTALCKPGCKVLPYKARLYGCIVELGHEYTFHNLNDNPLNATSSFQIKTNCWVPLIGGKEVFQQRPSEYMSASIDDWSFKTLTQPTLLFEFNLQDDNSRHQIDRQVLWNPQCIIDGVANGVIFWYDIFLESLATARRYGRSEPLAYSSRPTGIHSSFLRLEKDTNEESMAPTSNVHNEGVSQARYLPQALILLGSQSLRFKKNETLPLIAWHSATNIGVNWNEKDIPDFTLRRWPSAQALYPHRPEALAWLSCTQEHSENLGKMISIYMDKRTANMTARIAANIAVDSGFYCTNYLIDPYEAQRLLWSFYC